ncbi:MAG: hypothetical protein PHD05_09275, partial [Sphaerochaetaceae bacterium]|nr:hypothetical protein [Sphaerochaetaceae bacterium]
CLQEYNVFLIKKLLNYELSKELSLNQFENNIVEKLPNGKKFLLKKINNKIETIPRVELSKEIIREVLNDPRDFIIESYVLKDGNKDILYACDAYYINEDISKLSCIERKKYLKTLGFAIKFRLNPFVIVEKNDLEKAIKLFSKARNSNGVIVRNPDSFENSIMVVKSG